MQYYVTTILKTVSGITLKQKWCIKFIVFAYHCSSLATVTSLCQLMSGHPYPDFIAT